MSGRQCFFVLATLFACLGCGPSAAPVPGDPLRVRVETHLAGAAREWKQHLEHAALLGEIEQQDFHDYLRPVRVFWLGESFALGSAQGLEPHGGGILRFLLGEWRPDGRPAQATDRYPFPPSGVELGRLYRSHQLQIFLPDEDDGQGGLPRLRFEGSEWPVGAITVDAYHFLGLLLERERDLGANWTNHLGQTLSTERLLRRTWAFYQQSDAADLEPDDHSMLHLVEILLAFERRHASHDEALDPNEIKRRFLRIELARPSFPPAEETLLLGHYAESLGHLLAHPRVRFGAEERRLVREWLAALDRGPFRELQGVPARHLAHLLAGLRLVAEHGSKLD